MNVTSLTFLALILSALIIYYIVPKKFQWIILLLMSGVFYAYVGWQACFFVLITASTVYGANMLMLRLPKKDRRRKAVYLITLLLNLAILCVFKYLAFGLKLLLPVLSKITPELSSVTVNLIAPLGISFYTFQAVGYLTDVYWGAAEPEKNYFKSLLFVGFFAQMTQGPISDFKQLSGQLFSEHEYNYDNFARGAWRLLWGFVKKLLLANYIDGYMQASFFGYDDFSGLSTFLLIFLYAIEVYADFSGYMDIVCGACRMFGIELAENFIRPYFSKDVAEYWRRWHITMGTWFKKYVYYPAATSRLSQKLSKTLRRHAPRHVARALPATMALVITWFATGLWHRASLAYIVWGLLNGLVIIISMWLEPVYGWLNRKLHIRTSSRIWQAWQVARTFFVIALIKVLPDAGGLRNGLRLIFHAFTSDFLPETVSFDSVLAGNTYWKYYGIGLVIIALIFAFDLISRRRPVCDIIMRIPLAVRIMLFALIVVFTYMFGYSNQSAGFMYAQF